MHLSKFGLYRWKGVSGQFRLVGSQDLAYVQYNISISIIISANFRKP